MGLPASEEETGRSRGRGGDQGGRPVLRPGCARAPRRRRLRTPTSLPNASACVGKSGGPARRLGFRAGGPGTGRDPSPERGRGGEPEGAANDDAGTQTGGGGDGGGEERGKSLGGVGPRRARAAEGLP